MKRFYLGAALIALAACSQDSDETAFEENIEEVGEQIAEDAQTAAEAVDDAVDDMVEEVEEAMELPAEARLDAVLAAQSEEKKARYAYRHPKETLMFFGVEPGMTVVDSLPGEPGWYASILIPYLGSEGRLIGADYNLEMWPLMGNYATDEFMAARATWTDTYVAEASKLVGEDGADVSAITYGTAPAELAGEVDVILAFRALHHINRFEEPGGYFTQALEEMMVMLKPGGIVGVVQHRAPESNSDEWAIGAAGYLKQSHVIDMFEGAGFEFVEASEVNANPKDMPTEEDRVWRLPPSNDSEDAAAIGESDRMTLKFRKPE